MKRLALLLNALLVAACQKQSGFQDPFTRPQIDWKPGLQLNVDEATRILGNPSRLEKTTAYLNDSITTYQTAFRDDWIDPATGKTGVLYYMYEEWPSVAAAKSYLDNTLIENRVSPGNGTIMTGGAELHYLIGDPVVRMAMVCKENRLIRVKVNQVTSRYSVGEFRKVVESLAERL